MVKLRLRTKFLLSLLLVSAGVTCATLWMVGRSVRVQLRNEIAENLANSVVVFHDFQRQREINLASSAELLANLPSLKALMTTRDAATIQDASTDIWRLAPSDLFVLADPTGIVLAIHTSIPGITRFDREHIKSSPARRTRRGDTGCIRHIDPQRQRDPAGRRNVPCDDCSVDQCFSRGSALRVEVL